MNQTTPSQFRQDLEKIIVDFNSSPDITIYGKYFNKAVQQIEALHQKELKGFGRIKLNVVE